MLRVVSQGLRHTALHTTQRLYFSTARERHPRHRSMEPGTHMYLLRCWTPTQVLRHVTPCRAVLCPQEGGDEIDLDKEAEAEGVRHPKPKRARFERYEDDFIDDSEIEKVKGGPKVRTLYSGFYINKVGMVVGVLCVGGGRLVTLWGCRALQTVKTHAVIPL